MRWILAVMMAVWLAVIVMLVGGCASTGTGGGEMERLRRRSPYRSSYLPYQVWLEEEQERVCLPTDGRCG